LFTLLPLVACWRYEPREHLRLLALTRPLVLPSPLRDRVSYSDHDRFRGYFPVHFIPAYNLPVYASQRPLPDATQDSVRGCLLGFTAAVIADGRLQRACKAQPAQIRTCGFPAYGSHLGYRRRNVAVCEPTPVTRLAGTESSMCFIGPHSPRSLPFAPPTPPRIAPFCSSASKLL
jgi:hypothetical protein